jgi:hypothetical protein
VEKVAGWESAFKPRRAKTAEAAVTPIELLVTQWATILAIKLENNDAAFKFRTPWFKKTSPQDSSIFLLDRESSVYYYPISSTLAGEVLPGHPKVALIAFDRFRRSTQSLQLHFTDVKMSSERGKKHSFHFNYDRSSLATRIAEMLSDTTIVDKVEGVLSEQASKLRKQASTGCLLFFLAIPTAVLSLILLTCRICVSLL